VKQQGAKYYFERVSVSFGSSGTACAVEMLVVIIRAAVKRESVWEKIRHECVCVRYGIAWMVSVCVCGVARLNESCVS